MGHILSIEAPRSSMQTDVAKSNCDCDCDLFALNNH